MMNNYDMIVSTEEAFARRVALGVIMTMPLSAWHYFIPFMFVFDFLRRSSVISRYTRHFMFPRKLAIDAAQEISNGENRENRLSRVEEKIKEWLNSLNLYSQGLHRSQMEVVNLLIGHYSKLLNADGDTYNSLVKNAYNHRENYEVYLSQLASSEKEVDRAIIETLGETEKLREKIVAEQQQVEKQREKNLAEIF